jgi:hypothetical protein
LLTISRGGWKLRKRSANANRRPIEFSSSITRYRSTKPRDNFHSEPDRGNGFWWL